MLMNCCKDRRLPQLFMIELDDERMWFRYHGLFRDMLLSEFDRLLDERKSDLHRRASGWFERHNMIREAVEHAMAAPDMALSSTLIDRYADTLMFLCGETNLLVNWIEQFPESMLRERPGLMRVFAWALTRMSPGWNRLN